MKLNLVKDKAGKVIATFEPGNGGPSVEPVLEKEHSLHQVEVTDDYLMNIHSVYAQHSK